MSKSTKGANFNRELQLAGEHVQKSLKNKTVRKAIVYGGVFALGAVVAHSLTKRKK